MPDIRVSEPVRTRAINAGKQSWLDGLPEFVAELEREWTMTLGRSLSGGSEAFVAEVTLADQSPAILKLLIPQVKGSLENEIKVLRLANGEGCVRLLRGDETRSAMLLEKLGEPLHKRGLRLEQNHEILAAAAQRLWRLLPDWGLPTGAEKGRWLIEFISTKWQELGRPCPEEAVDYALACAERRIAAHDDERAVLVHGDIHDGNALESEDGYKLIDPDGLLAEPEYDLGVIMRVDPIDPADPRAGARALARRTGVDETATWEWAAAERMSTALVLIDLELHDDGRRMLAAAELAARA